MWPVLPYSVNLPPNNALQKRTVYVCKCSCRKQKVLWVNTADIAITFCNCLVCSEFISKCIRAEWLLSATCFVILRINTDKIDTSHIGQSGILAPVGQCHSGVARVPRTVSRPALHDVCLGSIRAHLDCVILCNYRLISVCLGPDIDTSPPFM